MAQVRPHVDLPAVDRTALRRRRRDLWPYLRPATARQRSAEPDELAALTDQERKIIDLIVEGGQPHTPPGRLFVSEKTVSVHVSSILRKLGVTSRVNAAAVAQRLHVT